MIESALAEARGRVSVQTGRGETGHSNKDSRLENKAPWNQQISIQRPPSRLIELTPSLRINPLNIRELLKNRISGPCRLLLSSSLQMVVGVHPSAEAGSRQSDPKD